MKTRLQNEITPRHPERGAIALVIAALWMTLFGLAALAVDIGYQYTSKRGLQAAADAAVRAGMPSLRTSQSTAVANATAMAAANGYTTGVTVTPSASTLTVTINVSLPSFFSRIFTSKARSMTATAVGKLSASAAPAIHANSNSGCGVGIGVSINGGGGLVITGDVEGGGGIVTYQTGPATTTTNGTAKSPCPGYPQFHGWDNITGGTSPTSTPDPFLGVLPTSFTCTVGNLATGMSAIPNKYYTNMGTCDLLAPGVYCANGNLAVAPIYTMAFCPTNATFVATGAIQIGANNGGTISAYATGVPRNIIAYSGLNTACSGGGPAINFGFNDLTLNGSIYAPNGCLNAGGTNMVVNGSLVGNEVFLGDYGLWTINAGSGGGPSWTMDQ